MIVPKNFTVFSALIFVSMTSALAVKAQALPQPRTDRSVVLTQLELPPSGFLGIQTENVSKDNFVKYNLTEPRGVAIVNVVASSPAKQAGVQINDVVVRFDGEEIKSVAKLMRLISEVAPDQKVSLTVLRGGSEQEIAVTMGKRVLSPEDRIFSRQFPPGTINTFPLPPEGMSGDFKVNNAPVLPPDNSFQRSGNGQRIGVSVSLLTVQLGQYFGAPSGLGVLVHQVTENGSGAKAGIKAGDVIVEVDGSMIANPYDLGKSLSKPTTNDVLITVIRDKQRQTLRVKPRE